VVVGAGPAGLSAAIGLARSGVETTLVSGPPRRAIPGHSLSPAGAALLRRLGVSLVGQRPCYGTDVRWGQPSLHRQDSTRDPRGHAWHVDTTALCAALREQALSAGVAERHGAVLQAPRRTDHGWQVPVQGGSPVEAAALVDATGRRAGIARRLGAARRSVDHQLALVLCLRPEGRLPHRGYVESTAGGWWYAAPSPGGQLVLLHICDPDPAGRRRLLSGWESLLPPDLARFAAAPLCAPPRLVPAGSQRLDPLTGDGWIAVGDAAMAWDPLSAHGLTVAIRSGLDGAAAVADWLGGQADALDRLATLFAGVADRYEQQRRALYQQEQRWPTSSYWSRRLTT